MEYQLLGDVNDSSQDWRIRVRVCRLWEHRDETRDAEVLRLHMVLGDEKGDGIHAIIPRGLITKFQELVSEGNVYYLQYLEISPAIKQYRTTSHRFEMRFTAWTKVRRIDPVPDGFPVYVYKLRSLKDIVDNITDKTYLIDVVALVNGVSEITEVSVKGKPTAKRNLRVTDGRHTAIVVLWSSNAEEIDASELIRRSHREPVIMLAMGCSFKMQDCMLMLTGSYGSKISMNLANPDVSAFRYKIAGIPFSIELLAERGRRFTSTEVEDTTVAYLADVIPHVVMQKVFRCKINVTAIPSNQNWWFQSCDQCSWKSVQDGDGYQCSKPGCGSRSASPRYKIPITAADGDASVEMVFFGDVGKDLIGKPADVLLSEFVASNSGIPREIQSLVGRNYVVEVAVSKYSFRKGSLAFQVLRFFSEGGSAFTDFLHAHSSSATGVASSSALPDARATVPSKETGPAHEVDLNVATPVKDVLEGGQNSLENVVEGSYEALQETSTEGGHERIETTGTKGGNEESVKTSAEAGHGGRGKLGTDASVLADCSTAPDTAMGVERPPAKRSRHGGGKGSAARRLFTDEQATAGQRAGQK